MKKILHPSIGDTKLDHPSDFSATSSFGIITILFALILKFIPDTAIQWRDIWIGAAVASLLFTVGKVIIGFFLGHSGPASAYAAASLVIFPDLDLLLGADIAVRG